MRSCSAGGLAKKDARCPVEGFTGVGFEDDGEKAVRLPIAERIDGHVDAVAADVRAGCGDGSRLDASSPSSAAAIFERKVFHCSSEIAARRATKASVAVSPALMGLSSIPGRPLSCSARGSVMKSWLPSSWRICLLSRSIRAMALTADCDAAQSMMADRSGDVEKRIGRENDWKRVASSL